jgi:hypothetical protein
LLTFVKKALPGKAPAEKKFEYARYPGRPVIGKTDN